MGVRFWTAFQWKIQPRAAARGPWLVDKALINGKMVSLIILDT